MNTTVKVGNIYSYQTVIGQNKNKRYRSETYKAYAYEIGMQINHLKPVKPPYHVYVHFKIKGHKKIDLDNMEKLFYDILESHQIIDDDVNIMTKRVRKTLGHKENEIIFKVTTRE